MKATKIVASLDFPPNPIVNEIQWDFDLSKMFLCPSHLLQPYKTDLYVSVVFFIDQETEAWARRSLT